MNINQTAEKHDPLSGEDQHSNPEEFNSQEAQDDHDQDGDTSKKRNHQFRHNKHHPRKIIHQTSKKNNQTPEARDLPVPTLEFPHPETGFEGIYLYKPGVELPNLVNYMQQTITIVISAEYINKNNPEYIRRHIFGTDVYTANSDAVCMAVHCGFINIHNFNHKKYEGIQIYCRVAKPKKTFPSSTKNGIVSKLMKGYNGNALKPEAFKLISQLAPLQNLEKYAMNMHVPIGNKRIRPKPKNLSSVIPIPETHIVFNMNNEPAYKYSIFNIADKGFDKSEWVIKKLDHSVLYLQGEDVKYQIVKNTVKQFFDAFKFSIVKNPEKTDNDFFAKYPPPLADDQVEVVYKDLEWEEILWGNKSIKIKDKEFTGLRSFKYYRMNK